jgi:UDP-glucuronate 4-epimerase
MQVLVTGAAGFIGSHLADRLLSQGHTVVGVDGLTPYYDPAQKQQNIATLLTSDRFRFLARDLRRAELEPLLADVEVVFHLAGQPGVRPSWERGFGDYLEQNVAVTQRLLEACRGRSLRRFVYASSSSVYGNAARYPTSEDMMPTPHSPYGVTKLAAEHLCGLYAANYGIPTTSLRYFTVYGPRQRPDMGIHRFINAGLDDEPIVVFGDGEQVRDFTYVSDVVDATVRAGMQTDVPAGAFMNVAGGSACTVNELVFLIAKTLGTALDVNYVDAQPGDVDRTGGSIERAAELLDWSPQVSLAKGVAEQVAWHRRVRDLQWLARSPSSVPVQRQVDVTSEAG